MAIPSWLSISQLSGSGDTVITITADTMESLVRRTTELVVSGNTKFVTVPVEQVPHDYSEDYFTFDILTSGKIYWQRLRSHSTSTTIQYRINGGEWTSISSTLSGASSNFSVQAGDVVEFKGNNNTYGTTDDINGGFRCTAQDCATFNVQGNIMSMIYGDNFQNQTVLPADNTFQEFFYNTSQGSGKGPVNAYNLVLPATTLTSRCYDGLFDATYSLVTPPKELPATTVPDRAYVCMFVACTAMTSAPVISATTLGILSCHRMFDMCYSLTVAPELSFTNLDDYCCMSMFSSCSAMTQAPSILPATSLSVNCYDSMFADCSAITTAPVLPAFTMVDGCYNSMFNGCSNLNYIKCLATNPSSARTNSWVNGVAPSGTFVKSPGVNWTVDSIHGIPIGWTVQDNDDDNYNYLTFTITGAGDINWKRNYNATARSIQYSKNGGAWTTLTPDSVGVKIYGLVPGDVVRFKGTNTQYGGGHTFGNADTVPVGHVTTAQFTMSGNIMSLIYGDNFIGKTSFPSNTTNNFYSLFNTVTGLTSAENLVLPVTSLTDNCYARLFKNCSGLTKSPKTIPAIEVSYASCAQMFMNCTSLVTAPVLSCTNLAESCYTYMFDGCSSLSVAPALPATKVYMYSYRSMFGLCTSLVNPPDMAMTTLANDAAGACMEMFAGCTSLVRSPHLKPLELYSYNGYGCYTSMFADCSSLTRIDCDAVSLMPSSSGSTLADATGYWVNGVSATGTFYKNSNATWTTGDDGIPTGWTVVDAV